jgi:hypothetical protein
VVEPGWTDDDPNGNRDATSGVREPMRTTPTLAACGLVLLVALFSTARPAPLAAASPSPSPSPAVSAGPSERPPERPPFEAWLDRPIPVGAAPGAALDVGVTIWDALGREIPRLGATIFVQAVPPAGGGDPVRVVAIRDWPGHFRAQVDAPAGGLDRIETGIPGTVCENDVCRPDDWLIPVAGAGPPPDAPITTIAEAQIDVGGHAIAANQPADMSVVVRPRADWENVPLPAEIVVRAREPRGPNLATAVLPLTDRAAGTYEGAITIPRAGDLVLEAATDADGGDATRFGTSMTPVTVAAGSGAGDGDIEEAPGPGTAADEGIPPIVLVLLVGAALLGAGVMFAGFRSGGSR